VRGAWPLWINNWDDWLAVQVLQELVQMRLCVRLTGAWWHSVLRSPPSARDGASLQAAFSRSCIPPSPLFKIMSASFCSVVQKCAKNLTSRLSILLILRLSLAERSISIDCGTPYLRKRLNYTIFTDNSLHDGWLLGVFKEHESNHRSRSSICVPSHLSEGQESTSASWERALLPKVYVAMISRLCDINEI